MSDLIPKEDPRTAAAKKFLDAGMEYWKICQKQGQGGAVQWIEDADGRLIIFTRGEYRHQLLSQVHDLPGQPKVNRFEHGDFDNE